MLASAGCTFGNVVKATVYIMDFADFPTLKTEQTQTAADDLAAQIERKVHEQILSSFDSPSGPAKHTAFGLLNLVLLAAAAAIIFLIVKAVL